MFGLMRRMFVAILVRRLLAAFAISLAGVTATVGAFGLDPSTVLGGLQALTEARTITGKVVGIADGDTLTVLTAEKRQHKIRLAGIDAPESTQAFGLRSKQALSALVFGSTVTVTVRAQDKYGRVLGIVRDETGRDINLAQIQAGMAWHYKAFEADQPRDERRAYAAAERAAQSARTGLWLDQRPIPPWDYRREKKTTL
jgi:endonuclease YncB( thermonuclease family)